MSTNMNLPKVPEKIPVFAPNGGIGFDVLDCVNKINEYHDFSEQLVTYLNENQDKRGLRDDCGHQIGKTRLSDGVCTVCESMTLNHPDALQTTYQDLKTLTEKLAVEAWEATAPQEKECEHNLIGYSSTNELHCTKCDFKTRSPSQQIDVKALLEEYVDVHNHTGMSARRGIETLVQAGEKRMSEIEEIINQAIKK